MSAPAFGRSEGGRARDDATAEQRIAALVELARRFDQPPGIVDQGRDEQLTTTACGQRSGQSDERVEAARAELRDHDRALQTGERCRRRRGSRRRRQRRVVLQDRALELLQTRARVEPELVGQRAPRLAQDVERLDGPAGAVERDGEVRPQRLTQRVLGDQCAQLAHELRVVAAFELGLDAALDGMQPHLVEPHRLGHQQAAFGEVGQRRPAPERERLRERGRRLLRPAAAQQLGSG